MNTQRLSFPKKYRLRSSQEFIHGINNSHKVIIKDITTFIKKNNLYHPRIGIIIAKKYIKHSYQRNHIKRLIRENFRIHQHSLPKIDFIITIKKNIIHLNNESIKKILKRIWRYSYDAHLNITNTINTSISNTHRSIN